MKIEDITGKSIREVTDRELYNLRLRSIQLWEKIYKKKRGQEVADFLSHYRDLVAEMNRRGIARQNVFELDRELMKGILYRLLPQMLDELVYVPDFVSLGGSFVRTPKQAHDIDLIIRKDSPDLGLTLKLGRVLEKYLGPALHFVFSPTGPHSSYIPLFDLVFRPKQSLVKVEIQDILKSENGYYAGLDIWDEGLMVDNLAVLQALAPGSVLDLGCGTGKFLQACRKAGRRTVGIDNNDTALSYCAMREIETRKLDLDTQEIPPDLGEFDNVTAIHALEHFRDPRRIADLAREAALKKVIFLIPLGDRQDPSHQQAYKSVDDLQAGLGEGWQVVEIEETHCALAMYDKIEKAGQLKPLQRFIPLKTASGYSMQEEFDIETMWEKWAKSYIDEGIDLVVQKKFSGWRTVLELDEKGRTLIYFEDTKKDRSGQFEELAEELKTIKQPVILDAEIEGISLQGKPIPRKDISGWGGNIKVPVEFTTAAGIKGRYVVHVFDILYLGAADGGGDLHGLAYRERRETLKKLFGAFDFKLIKLIPETVVSTKSAFIRAVGRVSRLPGSEGAVIKTVTGDYPLTGQTSTWAKIKTVVEFKVQVLERIPVKGSNDIFNYRVGCLRAGKVVEIGKTINVQLKASEGAVLTITAQEIIPKIQDGKLEISAVVPGVQDIDLDRKTPETAEEIARRAYKAGILQLTAELERELRELKILKAEEGTGGEFGNLDFEAGTKGSGVLQIHIMGIEPDRAEALRAASSRIMVTRGDLKKFQRLLLETVGEQGAHLDIRLRPAGKDFWEGGEVMLGNLTGLAKFIEADEGRKLRFAWKQSRAGEEKTPVVRGPLSWLEIGKRKVELFAPGEIGATTNLHAAMIALDSFTWELYLADEHAKKIHFANRYLKGNWLFASVPVSAAGKRGERVWMMSRLAEDDHKKVAKELTAAEQKDYDEETERIRESKKTPEAQKPHQFRRAKWTHPNGHPRCLICGDEEPIGLVCNMPAEWYGRREWDDDTGWAEERKKLRADGIIKAEGPPAKDFKKELEVFITKEDEHIIGGIVYEPDIVDSQGDSATTEEIRRAAFDFMANIQRFDVRHSEQANPQIKVLESYIAPQELLINGHRIRKGSWYMTLRVLDEQVWRDIKAGKLTGFSIFGTAFPG